MLTYLSLKEDETDLMWADELHGFEVSHFQLNEAVERQALLIADLPKGEWPESIMYLKGKSREQVASLAKSVEDSTLAMDYWSRDKMVHDHCTACCERKRVESFHAKALSRVPVARRDKAMLASKNKRVSEENVRLGKPSV